MNKLTHSSLIPIPAMDTWGRYENLMAEDVVVIVSFKMHLSSSRHATPSELSHACPF